MFDKSKVYTALNADELEVGDVVIVADSLYDIQQFVQKGEHVCKIESIESSDSTYRFDARAMEYALAYLIAKHDDPYKEFKKAQAEGQDIWYRCDSGKWNHGHAYSLTDPIDRYSLTDPTARQYKVFLHDGRFMFTYAEVPDGAHVYYSTSDANLASDWCTEHNKFAEVAKAREEGKKIQVKFATEWRDDRTPSWNTEHEYRVKPASLKWTDLEVGDSIKKGSITSMVTGIDAAPQTDVESDMHVHTCLGWLSDEGLTEWEVVE